MAHQRAFRSHAPGDRNNQRGRSDSRGGMGGRENSGGNHGGQHGGSRGQVGSNASRPPQIFRPADSNVIPAIDPGVRSIEGAAFKKGLPQRMGALKVSDDDDEEWPSRPAYGTEGNAIVVRANYMAMALRKVHARAPSAMHRYKVTFAPPSTLPPPIGKKCARLIRLLFEQLPADVAKATEFAEIIIANHSLGFDVREFFVLYRHDDESTPGPSAPSYQVTVQSNGVLSLDHVMEYLSSSDPKHPIPANREEIGQALNIIAGYGLKSATTTIMPRGKAGTNRYFPFAGEFLIKQSLDASNNVLDALRGYAISVRLGAGRLLLNVQVKHIAIYTAITVDQVMRRLRASKFSDHRMERFLRGCNVKVTLPNRRGAKSIISFARPGDGQQLAHPPVISRFAASARQVQFWLDDHMVSVAHHFLSTHGRDVDPTLPTLNVGTSQDPTYYPPEVCIIAPGQAFNNQLSTAQTSAMIDFAVRPPYANAQSITTQGQRLLSTYSTPALDEFELKVDPALVAVPARVLMSPVVAYLRSTESKSLQVKFVPPKEGSWNMTGLRFSKPGPFNNGFWVAVWLRFRDAQRYQPPTTDFRTVEDLKRCLGQFQRVLVSHGVTVDKDCNIAQLVLEEESHAQQAIANWLETKDMTVKPKFVVFLLPQFSKTIRDDIKIVADLRFGLNHVCCISHKFGKNRDTDGNKQYFANVALKINLKLHGHNQQLQRADLGFIAEGRTMLVGLDVTHPSPGSRTDAPSVVGIVASIDGHAAQFPAAIRSQRGFQEEVDALTALFESRLRLWQKYNRQLPENIIVYRDGVSEGQYNMVLDREMVRIRDACKTVYPPDDTKNHRPLVTIVIVGKRHHTRFYPTNIKDTHAGSSNLKNGTVVDRGVTEARLWDFYLQAHTAVKGTARPAHYVVIHDEIFRQRAMVKSGPRTVTSTTQNAADSLQTITHNLCYMFGRATKAVSVCPPAYYADLVCDRARCWLSNVYDANSDTASVTSGAPGTVATAGVTEADTRVHDDIKDTMFYI